MGQGDFIAELKTMYNTFTKSEKKVADYVIANPTSVPFMGISELADACGVGETTVFRFCRTLKLSGYQEFKMKISISSFDSNILRNTTSGEIRVDDSFEVVVDKIFLSNMMALKETRSLINMKDLSYAVDLLIGSDNIYFYGVGSSQLTAMETMNRFLRITKKAHTIEDSHMQLMQASMLCEKDVAVIFSYSGNTIDTIQIAQTAKESGAKVIGISKFKTSEFSKYTDILLLCGAKEDPIQGGSLSAKISQIYIINLLYTEYYRRTYIKSKTQNKKTSKAIVKKLY